MEGFVGQIILFGGGYAPEYWALCDGSSLSVSQNPALFSIIGTTYGGNGTTTFNLPDLRARIPIGAGQGTASGATNHVFATAGGTAAVTLSTAQIPAHTHTLYASTDPVTTQDPTSAVPGSFTDGQHLFYFDPKKLPSGVTATPSPLGSRMIQTAGISSSHNNVMPSLGISYLICVQGIYPQRP
jgi:microcystin-dependent protein